MKKPVFRALFSALTLSFAAGSTHAVSINESNSATVLANTLAGQGITISNAVLSTASDSAAGTFTQGGNIGFDAGVLLTTGTTGCAVGPNTSGDCSGTGASTSLKFDFTSSTGAVSFKYVFASEEYLDFVGTEYNDLFELKLNGVNIALLPGDNGVVSINNVHPGLNSAFFRYNDGSIDTQYNGLTTVLTASASNLKGVNTFEFLIQDRGDDYYDSGVFIEAGTFSSQPGPVPEPRSVAMLSAGLMGIYAATRKRKQAR